MGFWIFMFVCNLLIPCTMIGFGHYFMKSAPKEINAVFGYRTARSMKNKDTWTFSHLYCGKLWRGFGWLLLTITAIGMPFVLGKSQNIVGAFGGVVCVVQLIFLIGSVFPTEFALKKTFDKNGNRRN